MNVFLQATKVGNYIYLHSTTFGKLTEISCDMILFMVRRKQKKEKKKIIVARDLPQPTYGHNMDPPDY